MRFVKHPVDIEVKNIDDFSLSTKSSDRRHSALLPNTLRCIIAGRSNCGKTNLLIGLIEWS